MVAFLISSLVLALTVITLLLVFTLGGRIDLTKEQKGPIEYVAIAGFVILSFFMVLSTLFFTDRFLITKKTLLLSIKETLNP